MNKMLHTINWVQAAYHSPMDDYRMAICMMQKHDIAISCNMCTSNLPDKYVLGIQVYIQHKSLVPNVDTLCKLATLYVYLSFMKLQYYS